MCGACHKHDWDFAYVHEPVSFENAKVGENIFVKTNDPNPGHHDLYLGLGTIEQVRVNDSILITNFTGSPQVIRPVIFSEFFVMVRKELK